MPRGGRRAGKAGVGYSERTDLNSNPRLPVTTVPGQPYGQAGEQAAAQQAVPMGSPPVPPSTPPGSVAAGAPDEGSHPEPGSFGDFTMGSVRPGEHVLTGAPTGPGAGPEILGGQPLTPLVQGVAILNSLGKHLPPELASVVKYLNVTQNNGQGQ